MSNEPSTVSCPNCGQTYSVTAEQRAAYGSRPITCTQCQRPFTVDGSAAAADVVPAYAPAASMPPGMPPGYPPMAAGGPPVGYATPGPYGPPLKTNGWAITSLVLGCLSVIVPVIAPVGAIITGAVGMAKTKRPGVGGRGLAIAGLSVGIVGLVLQSCVLTIFLPALNRSRHVATRIACAATMRSMGQGAQMYAAEYRGQYPAKVEQLILGGYAQPNVLVCPACADTPAPGGNPQAQAANLATPGHLSFIYLGGRVYAGKPLSARSRADMVLAYEPLSNHDGDGANVLYNDGHVQWKDKNVAVTLIAELEAGQNPPPSDKPY